MTENIPHKEIHEITKRLKLPYSHETLMKGYLAELEHGKRDNSTNVTGDDIETTIKIAVAHLNEFPDYYERLEIMESDWFTILMEMIKKKKPCPYSHWEISHSKWFNDLIILINKKKEAHRAVQLSCDEEEQSFLLSLHKKQTSYEST